MKQSLQQAIQDELPDANYPDFEPGDLIRVITQEMIGGQQRKRTFEGVCIARRGEGPDETFKVRKNSFGVGVERIFPIHSPLIEDVEIVRKGKVRRARLNYLEGRSSKEARIKERRVDLEEANRVDGPAEAEAPPVQEEPDAEAPGEEPDAEEAEETQQAPETAGDGDDVPSGEQDTGETPEAAGDGEEAPTAEQDTAETDEKPETEETPSSS